MIKTNLLGRVFIALLILAAVAIGGFWVFVYQPSLKKEKLEEAISLLEAGNYRAAIPILENFVASRPSLPGKDRAAVLLARSYAESGDYEKAFSLWEKIVAGEDSPPRDEGLFYLGWLRAKRGEREKAEKILREHARQYPGSAYGGRVQLALARIKDNHGQLLAARENYRKVLENFPDSPVVEEAQNELGDLNLRILFSPLIDEGSREYTVEKGDSLFQVAAKFHTTAELLQKANQLSGSLIRDGQKLKIPRHRFEVVVSKAQNSLMLVYGGEFFKIYPVGTGAGGCTPIGTFTIASKLPNPPWFTPGKVISPDDRNNILGSRWMGFNEPHRNYGIHGTTEPETIGSQSSSGCIRMHNRDVEELFDLLPRGTKVIIVE